MYRLLDLTHFRFDSSLKMLSCALSPFVTQLEDFFLGDAHRNLVLWSGSTDIVRITLCTDITVWEYLLVRVIGVLLTPLLSHVCRMLGIEKMNKYSQIITDYQFLRYQSSYCICLNGNTCQICVTCCISQYQSLGFSFDPFFICLPTPDHLQQDRIRHPFVPWTS